MTRAERILTLFGRYDALAESCIVLLGGSHGKPALEELRKEVEIIKQELTEYGCRRLRD